MIIIKSRPVLADKLQFHISPDFLSIDDDSELFYDGHVVPFFEKDIQLLYGGRVVYFDGVKKGNRPYFQLPNDFNPLTSLYILNTRVCLRKPFTVVVDYNLIRNVLDSIKQDCRSGYDKKYHESIQLHDDNFIDTRIWSNWDDVVIHDIEINLKDKIKEFSNNAFRYLIEDHDLEYSIVSLKHAEFNIDYNVGSRNSLPLILAFSRFVYSDRGLAWRSEIESISMIQQSVQKDFDRTITNQDGHAGHTFKFNITKGLSLKVYQKSDDHIRVELTFEGSFIKQRIGVFSFDRVYPALLEFSKDFFKILNFEGILYMLSKEELRNDIDNESGVDDLLDRCDPVLLSISEYIRNHQVISDPKLVSRICGDSRLRPLFKSTVDTYGHRAYSYSPYKRSKRFKRLKPPSSTKKLLPVQCKTCKSFYHSDLLKCPYCNDKNSEVNLSNDPNYLDFISKVNKYKEGGYVGL